jgi:hypothetical protein
VKSYVVAAVAAGSLVFLAGCGSSSSVVDVDIDSLPTAATTPPAATPSPSPTADMGDSMVADVTPVENVTTPEDVVAVEGVEGSISATVGDSFTLSYTPDMRVGNTMSVVVMDGDGNPTDIVEFDSDADSGAETQWSPNHKFTALAPGSAQIVFIELDESGEQVGDPMYYLVTVSE